MIKKLDLKTAIKNHPNDYQRRKDILQKFKESMLRKREETLIIMGGSKPMTIWEILFS